MRKSIMIILAVLLAAVSFMSASAEIIEYNVKDTQANKIDKSKYVSDTEYLDESIHAVISYGRANDTDYMIVRVSVANGTQIRTAMASRDGKSVEAGSYIAKKSNAIIGITGDSFSTNKPGTGKHIIRQGRRLKHNAKGELDVLIIDDKGNLDILLKATEDDIEKYEGEIINAFSFGPALIYKGELMEIERDDASATEIAAQRVALCQLNEVEEGYNLSYLCVISAGPENPGSKGMNLHQFAQVVYDVGQDIGGVTMAYNLDGGSSATVAFKGKKINTFGSEKVRSISDIIYFASAWVE